MDSYFWQASIPDYFTTLDMIMAGEEYLVDMNDSRILIVTGIVNSEIGNTVPLQEDGWQFIGCPFFISTPFSNNFNTTNRQLIKNFDGFWNSAKSHNSIDSFKPGKGYFIKK